MWVLMLIGVSLISWSAMAHDPGRPEVTSRILGQSNQTNGMCCDGMDMFVPAAFY